MTVEHRGSGQGPVVGRDFELARVGHFLDNITVAPTALLVEGEPGIGKTTVWVAAIAAAEARGFRVLQARAAETEVRLSHAALADLVGADFEATRTALPSVQQRALAAALLRAEDDDPAQPRTIATAFVGVLAALAETGVLLVAIDDVQWLDPASAGALAFAARRLPPRVGLLLTRRGDPAELPPLGLQRALPEDRSGPAGASAALACGVAPPDPRSCRFGATSPGTCSAR